MTNEAFPNTSDGPLPAAALEALRRGDKIDAIRIVREELHLGLTEARDLVENQHRRDRSRRAPSLSAAIIAALHKGHRIEAIRILRKERHIGLKESRVIIDEYVARQPSLRASVSATDSTRNRWALLWLAGFVVLAGLLYSLLTR